MQRGRIGSTAVKAIKWPLVLAVAGTFFVLLAVSTGRETYRSWTVNREIRDLQAQVDALEGKKMDILNVLDRLHATDTLDREARLRMNMKLPGERVIVVKGDAPLSIGERDEVLLVEEPEKNLGNPQKWFRYFFNNN